MSRVNRRLPLLIRAGLKPGVHLGLRALKHFAVTGAERLPSTRRPMVIACNHPAFIDSVYLSCAIRPRFVICGAKPKYFRTRPRRALMALGNILEVRDEDTFVADCGRLLADGQLLLIYPEMGRNPDGLGPFTSSLARVATTARVPVLPCYLYGTTRGHQGAPHLYVGASIEPATQVDTLTAEVRAAIEALRAESGADQDEDRR